jgi:hypothetical protein
LWKWQAGFERGLGKVFVCSQHRVRICLDEIDFVRSSNAEVQTRVSVNGQQPVDAFAGLLDTANEGRFESFSELILQAPALAIFLVPLGSVGGDFGFIRRHFLENQFADRKDAEPMISEDADVKFASLDVFLGDHIAVELIVDELHALAELLVVFDKGRLRNSEVGVNFFL